MARSGIDDYTVAPCHSARGTGRMDNVDPLDVDLEDTELLGEVELTAALIVAANQAKAHLSESEIDQILGLVPPQRSSGESA